MSVIVKRLKSSSMEIYVKGAPEVMMDICDKSSCECFGDFPTKLLIVPCRAIPVPQDYDDLLSYYTKRGYRVIAVAGKSIAGLSWLKAQKMKRCHQMTFISMVTHEFAIGNRQSLGFDSWV